MCDLAVNLNTMEFLVKDFIILLGHFLSSDKNSKRFLIIIIIKILFDRFIGFKTDSARAILSLGVLIKVSK